VRLLLNIEQLLSEEVSVFEEVIFVKMPEMTAMLPKIFKFFREAHCRADKPYTYIDGAINYLDHPRHHYLHLLASG
jgi:hypothetical protein